MLRAEDPAHALGKRPCAHGVPAQPRAQPRVEEEALHQHGAVQGREDPAVEDEKVADLGKTLVGSGAVDAGFGAAREEFLFLFGSGLGRCVGGCGRLKPINQNMVITVSSIIPPPSLQPTCSTVSPKSWLTTCVRVIPKCRHSACWMSACACTENVGGKGSSLSESPYPQRSHSKRL